MAIKKIDDDVLMLMVDAGWTHKRAAKSFDCSRPAVSQRIKLLTENVSSKKTVSTSNITTDKPKDKRAPTVTNQKKVVPNAPQEPVLDEIDLKVIKSGGRYSAIEEISIKTGIEETILMGRWHRLKHQIKKE